MKKAFFEEKLPAAYASLESILKSNKGGDGFLVGDGVSAQHIIIIIIIVVVIIIITSTIIIIITTTTTNNNNNNNTIILLLLA